jgi:hypothetical protein
MSKLRADDWVEVRSKEEILRTLDNQGRLDGMPFMPEMFKYCGKRFKVYKRAHKTCDTIVHNWKSPGRHLGDGIHLNLRCNGTAHGGCQAACLVYWKEAWLKPVYEVERPAGTLPNSAAPQSEGSSGNGGCTESDVLAAARADDPKAGGEPRYACQATQALDFTTPLPWWDFRQYVEDYTSGNVTLGQIFRGFLWSGYFYGTLAFNQRFGMPARWLYDRFQSSWGGLPYPRHRGTVPAGQATPTATLKLQPGEFVRVKSYQEILATLDTKNKNRGMSFDGEMMPYCGGMFRVRGQVEKFIEEKTGFIKRLKTPAVILEGAYCRARYSDHRMFCPRSIFPWWREVWLERVFDNSQQQKSDSIATAGNVATADN